MAQDIQREELLIRDKVTGELRPYYVAAENINLGDDETYKSLPDVLDEMQDEIDQAGQGGGGGTAECDDAMSETSEKPVQNKIIKAYVDAVSQRIDTLIGSGNVQGAIDTFNEVKAFLEGISSSDTLAAKLALLTPQSRTINGLPLTSNVTIGMSDIQGLVEAINNAGSGAVSVIQPDPADGTFTIRVGSTDYTINLNHTHEGMAKLVKVTEATLPQTLENDTIYVQVDNLATPTEIEALYIFGLEFAGGGVPSGTPAITKPSGTTINLGTNFGSGVSKQIEIKANGHITGDLTVGLAANSDLSFDTTNLPSGVTYNSGEGALTIAQATAMQGVNITIVYSGSGAAEIAGGLIITGGGASPKSLIVEVVAPVALTAIKLTGTQWLQTDYYPNADTEFEMELKFSENSYTDSLQSVGNGIFLLRASNSTGSNRWDLNNGNNSTSDLWKLVMHLDAETVNTDSITTTNHELLTADHAIVKLIKTSSTKATFYFAGRTIGALNLKVGTTSLPLAIGYNYQAENSSPIYKAFDVTIYRLTITENGSTVRNYVPAALEGVPGLYDEINGEFISSKTESELVAIE